MFKMSITGMNTSVFAICQLHHQSATAPSRATHALDAVTAHRCHELWSDTHVAEWLTTAPDMWPPNSLDLNQWIMPSGLSFTLMQRVIF